MNDHHIRRPGRTRRIRRGLAITAVLAVCAARAAPEATIHPTYLADADLSTVQQLIADGADVNARHIGGATALHHLVTVSAEMGLVGQRIHKGRIYFAGQWKATGHKALAEALIQGGAEVDAADALGRTPLHVAALTGHSEAVRFLLARGANVNAQDSNEQTPLALAEWGSTDAAIAEFEQATGQSANADGIRRRARAVIELLQSHGAR